MPHFFDRKETGRKETLRPVSTQSRICLYFTLVAQTHDFTDIFYVCKIAQTVSSLSKILQLRIAPKRSDFLFIFRYIAILFIMYNGKNLFLNFESRQPYFRAIARLLFAMHFFYENYLGQ